MKRVFTLLSLSLLIACGTAITLKHSHSGGNQSTSGLTSGIDSERNGQPEQSAPRTTASQSVANAALAADAKSAAGTKTEQPATPTTASVSQASPTPDAKPAAEVKPGPDLPTASKTVPNTPPIPDAKSPAGAKPEQASAPTIASQTASNTPPTPAAKPVAGAKPEQPARPTIASQTASNTPPIPEAKSAAGTKQEQSGAPTTAAQCAANTPPASDGHSASKPSVARTGQPHETVRSTEAERKSLTASNKKSAKSSESKPESAKSDTAEVVAINRSSRNGPRRMVLVPPPPPETPSILPPVGSFPVGQVSTAPIELMSAEMLKERQKILGDQIKLAKQVVKNKESDISEKEQRAQQFSSLYEEGVISRRELETSQKEFEQLKEEVGSAKLNLSNLEHMANLVSSRLKLVKRRH